MPVLRWAFQLYMSMELMREAVGLGMNRLRLWPWQMYCCLSAAIDEARTTLSAEGKAAIAQSEFDNSLRNELIGNMDTSDALATDGATAHVHVELGDELGHRADVGHGKQCRA